EGDPGRPVQPLPEAAAVDPNVVLRLEREPALDVAVRGFIIDDAWYSGGARDDGQLTLGLVCVELGIHKIPDGPVVLGPLGIVGRLDQVAAHRVDGVWYCRGNLGDRILPICAHRPAQPRLPLMRVDVGE